MYYLLGFEEETSLSETEYNYSYPGNNTDFMFDNYLLIGSIFILVSLLYLIGGIFLKKYKAWANLLVTIVLAIFILLIWSMMIMLYNSAKVDGLGFFSGFAILVASAGFFIDQVFESQKGQTTFLLKIAVLTM